MELRWKLGDTDLDARVVELLRGVAHGGSLQSAITRARLSYRHAWGTLERIGNALGEPLVILERGRGAHLSPLGETLLRAADEANARLRPHLEAIEATLNPRFGTVQSAPNAEVVIHASHDMALAALRDRLLATRRVHVELHFHGSLECLAALDRGMCDIAGFHVPEAAAVGVPLEQYRPWLKGRTLRLMHFATRQQGLMVGRGNPHRLKTLRDIAQTKARFVNRQSGSGTRLLFDHLLAVARIRPTQINGHQHEEFTHAAVAATVASGMADVGFGIEAAARQHRLEFVPVASERYFLAARASVLARPGPAVFLAALRSGMLGAVLQELPGYREPRSLELLSVKDAFPSMGTGHHSFL
ncbi:MAG: helix-turn-helix transcriptional regulator [Betaproteobacteria bacterium]|nr:helix-turn-helix transcriptional regulator [Betaproteobacteria bacterium]